VDAPEVILAGELMLAGRRYLSGNTLRPVFVIVVIMSAAVSAQERVVGLLSLPEVFGPRQCAPFDPSEVALHGAPTDGRAVAFIRVDRPNSFAPHGGCEGLEVSVHAGERQHELPTREYDYEMPAAIVLEHRDGWFRIKLHDRSAWVKASLQDRFMPLSELFDEFVGVTAINKFSGRLRSAPGTAIGPIMPAVVPQTPVRVLEIRGDWIRVEVLSHSACTAGDDGPPETVAAGWLPLHDSQGEPAVWFSSRGC
jgi:hypothetical protein